MSPLVLVPSAVPSLDAGIGTDGYTDRAMLLRGVQRDARRLSFMGMDDGDGDSDDGDDMDMDTDSSLVEPSSDPETPAPWTAADEGLRDGEAMPLRQPAFVPLEGLVEMSEPATESDTDSEAELGDPHGAMQLPTGPGVLPAVVPTVVPALDDAGDSDTVSTNDALGDDWPGAWPALRAHGQAILQQWPKQFDQGKARQAFERLCGRADIPLALRVKALTHFQRAAGRFRYTGVESAIGTMLARLE
ncbi:hypothetical protein BC831DRAFT_477278 [Entophlyctis helioformis]|nr:hypothetical protein BC831DRAFT_477278 [Entophlyctis helioformis]